MDDKNNTDVVKSAPNVDDDTAEMSNDVEMATLPAKGVQTNLDDPYLVVFATPFDADNPKDWPTSKKWTVTDVLSATGFNRIMVSTIMAPAISTIASELHMSSAESFMALSIYLLATAFGPLLVGPLSEVYGRKPVLHASNVWFLIWNIVCGFAKTKQVLIAGRFLAGFGASAIYALGGGVLGDVWRVEQRGRTLGWYLLIPLMGAAVGPIIGGFMAARTTWRWMFWSTSIFQAVMIVASYLAFRETYPPLILHRRAARLRKETCDARYTTAAERLERDHPRSIPSVLSHTLSRPLRLLVFHPIIQIIAILQAFQYGLLYIVLATFSDLWVRAYGQSVEISGLHYIACAAGEIAGSQIGGPLMDRIFAKLKNRANGDIQPEFHIPLMIPGSILTPIGFLVYGWAAQSHAHWFVVDFEVFLTLFSMMIAGQPTTAYIIDAYPDYASSATAASQFLRSLTAFIFPLFAPYLYRDLGYGWGNSVLALAAAAVMLPAPAILWVYGKRLREKAYRPV